MLTALILASAVPNATPTRLPPVEQCADQSGFVDFRRALTTAISARDMSALLALMSDDVRVSFGGRYGKAEFANYWSQSPTERHKLWHQMDTIMRLGCATARDGGGGEYRAFPAMFVTSGSLDGFTTWVTLPNAVLRARPALGAQVVMRVPAWTVLEEVEWNGGGWVEAHTPKGRRGHVAVEQVRSIIDYRLVVGQRGGRWLITAFVAGD